MQGATSNLFIHNKINNNISVQSDKAMAPTKPCLQV